MIRSNLSILGLYFVKKTIFDDIVIPEGLDKDILVDNILMECGELESLYPDADFMKIAIKQWSSKECPVWQHLKETTEYEYNPIWNKDGTISETRTITGNDSKTITGSNSRNTQGSANSTGSSVKSDSRSTQNDTTESKAAYNESTMQAANKSENSISDSNQTTVQDSANSQTTATETGSNNQSETGSNSQTETYSRTESGNIGVTMTQQMIQAERDIAIFNIYDIIIKSFKTRFCLLIY